MKRLHLVLLLAGVLAVGSAFTTTKTHRDPCDGLEIRKVTDDGVPHQLTDDGTCTGKRESCTMGFNQGSGQYDIPCNDGLKAFVPASK